MRFGLVAGKDDTQGIVTCSCGHRVYAGYLREFEYLSTRRQWLWDRIIEGAGTPDTHTAREYGIWPVTTVGPAPVERPRSTSPQTLLVSIGAGLLIIAALVFVAVTWDLIGPIGQILLLTSATALTTVTAILLRERVPRTAEALAVVAFMLGLIVAGAAPELGALPRSWGGADSIYGVAVAAGAVLLGVGLGHRFAMVTWVWLGWLSTPILLGSGLGLLVDAMGTDEQLTLTIGAVAFLALGGALAFGSRLVDPVPQRLTAGVSLLVAAVLTVALLAFDPPTGATVVIAAALLLLLLAQEATGNRAAAWVGWPLFGTWLAIAALHLPDGAWLTAAMAAAGVALLFGIARWGVGLAAVSAGALWTTWLVAAWEPEQWLFFAFVGLGILLFSLRDGAAPLAWFGALSLEVAFLLRVDDVPFFEVPTLVLAGLLLLAGLIQVRAGEPHSLVAYGPAVTAALLPSSLLVWDDMWSQASLIRFGIVLVASVGCLLLGVRAHMLGLVIPGAVAVSIASTAQLWATLDTLPRWLALALAGSVLIVVGARIEWVRGQGERAGDWLQTLH